MATVSKYVGVELLMRENDYLAFCKSKQNNFNNVINYKKIKHHFLTNLSLCYKRRMISNVKICLHSLKPVIFTQESKSLIFKLKNLTSETFKFKSNLFDYLVG